MSEELKQPTPDEIRSLLKSKDVTREKAAGLVHVGLRTFHSWVSPIGSTNYRPMPIATWELLLIKLDAHSVYKRVDIMDTGCV
jgi:hypothetical protein